MAFPILVLGRSSRPSVTAMVVVLACLSPVASQAQIRQACGADVASHCSSSRGNLPRMAACFQRNKAKLSARCTALLERIRNGAGPGERFVKLVKPLDTIGHYCLDIRGHKGGVQLKSTLWVHTCKPIIWHRDGIFDAPALAKGRLRMPEYNLCVQADGLKAGATVRLQPCMAAAQQAWQRTAQGRIVLKSAPTLCLTVAKGAGGDAGFGFVAREVSLQPCNSAAAERQTWVLARPGS